jgi:tRNA(Ile)-lysidine synthase
MQAATLDAHRSPAVPWNTFLGQLADWLDARQLLASNSRWVLGVSGGADSTLLAHAMADLAVERNLNWRFDLAHLHHGLRGAEADADEAFVSDLAEQLGAKFWSERVDVPAQRSQEGGSTEEVARRERYAFLERVALKVGSDRVVIAHHADDDAETIFHRVCRGTGLRGLAGMAAQRPIRPGSRVTLLRPLLSQRRATIDALVNERGIAFREDASNLTGQYTRGKIRNTLLPLIREQLNPNVTEALVRLGEQARWLGTYLQDAAARTFDSLVMFESPHRVVLNTRVLLTKQRIIQAEVVRLASLLVIGGEQDLGFTHIDAVLRLAADPGSGKEVHLPNGIVVRKQYERLEFRSQALTEPPEIAPCMIKCPGATKLPLLNATLTIEELPVDSDRIERLRRDNSPYEEWVDLERVLPPLFVRGRLDGDRFHPLGAPGAKTLSDFFIDEKVDPYQRARTGVLCDQAGPIWIMPLRIDERVKLRHTSQRALRLLLDPALIEPSEA